MHEWAGLAGVPRRAYSWIIHDSEATPTDHVRAKARAQFKRQKLLEAEEKMLCLVALLSMIPPLFKGNSDGRLF